MKKLLLAVGVVALVLVSLPLVAAFEAHVINVSAQIENALYVHPATRNFGTVFPQEYLTKGIFVTFSESFSAENQNRVGTVEYIIKQKPKPRDAYVQQVGLTAAREWCHDNYPTEPYPGQSQQGQTSWQVYLTNCHPLLCPYLSKTPDNFPPPGNDTGLPPFHDPFATSSLAYGKINKFGDDVGDNWIIDLTVPCFQGSCSQDWADFVHRYNPQADAFAYQLPPALEHEVFGCDLWVEVTSIY